jgi:hypothetical protein
MFLSILFVVSPWFIFLILKSIFPKALFETFNITMNLGSDLSLPIPVFNITESIFSKYNNFSLMFWLFRLLPFIVLVFLFFVRKNIEKKEFYFIFLSVIFSVLIFIQALHRTSYSHLKQVIPIEFLLLAWLLSIIIRRETIGIIYRVGALFLIIIMIFGWINFVNNFQVIKHYRINSKCFINNYKSFFYSMRKLRKQYKNNVYLKVAEFINNNTLSDEGVMYIPLNPQLYYFSDRIFKTSLGSLGPGRLYNSELQEKFFKELIGTKTNIIIDDYSFVYDKKRKRNPRYYYSHLMKQIYSRYRIIKKIGKQLILCRDTRFDKYLQESKNRFELFKNKYNKPLSNISVSIKSINTFPPKHYIKKVYRKSFLLVKGEISGFSKKEIKNIYFGLKNKSKIFYIRVTNIVKQRKHILKFEVFSSLVKVKNGKYRFIILVNREKNAFKYLMLNKQIEIL